MPAFSMAENSALATANLSGSRQQDLAKTSGPGQVRRWRWTRWQGGEAVKPSVERMSGKSRSRSETHFEVERRAARRDEDVCGENGNEMAGEPAEDLLKTFWLATSNRKL